MAEARDRLSRSNNRIEDTYIRRLISTGTAGVFLDDHSYLTGQNTPRFGSSSRRGRGSHSVLPRTPLRDVSHVVWAAERRSRVGLGDGEGQSGGEDPSALGSQVEHETPKPKVTSKTFPLFTDVIGNEGEGDSELTPQRLLLNSTDIVQKVVMVELDRSKRTPSAKKAERERKVKTLMSMR